jgi:hypothetical protein
MGDTCCVVDQFCESPANLSPPVYVRGRCFRCDQGVCRKCSTKRNYGQYGRVRLCNNCQVDEDGNDKRVMARLYKLAGYSTTERKKEQARYDR